MAPIIRQNRGFVSQFLGDGILALFPENSSDAVDAALDMIKALPDFNKEINERGFASAKTGISINSGDVMLCALGEEERLEASVVSDVINAASRIEGLNKLYKTQVLISDTAHEGLANPEKYLIRRIDKVRLRGKKVGKDIYEVKQLPEGEELQKEHLYLSQFSEAFTLYENGDFVHAEAAFKRCLEVKPEDTVAALQLSRCQQFQKTGKPDQWDGTIDTL